MIEPTYASRCSIGRSTVATAVVATCSAWLMLSRPIPASADDQIRLDGATAEVCFTPGADCASAVARAISAARERVWLMGYGFSEDSIVTALVAARQRGLDVRLILDRSNEKAVYSGANYVGKLGVPIWIDRSVRIAHNKLILIDKDTVVMGSLNWTKSGNTKNAENVHIFRSARKLGEQHEAYFRSRQAVSALYKPPTAGPTTR